MPTSYNGWSASPDRNAIGIVPLVVAGEPFSPGVRGGAVHTVLGYVAEQLHRRVEPIVRSDWHQADDWGYAYRANVNNPSSLSCHASGTAIDYNATRHPNGKGGTWTAAQKAEIGRILAEVNNVVKTLWGYDEMHFEISGTAAQVAAAAQKVKGGVAATEKADPNDDFLTLGDSGPAVKALQEVLNRFYPKLPALAVDGDFGQATADRVKHFQKLSGLTADGEVGPGTRAKLGLKPPQSYTGTPVATPPKLNAGGGIERLYNSLSQADKDRLGLLRESEHVLQEGVGWIARFQNGQIFYKEGLGAACVWQGLLLAYGEQGWQNGKLGYPVTNEILVTLIDFDGTARAKALQVFEHGSIVYDLASDTSKRYE